MYSMPGRGMRLSQALRACQSRDCDSARLTAGEVTNYGGPNAKFRRDRYIGVGLCKICQLGFCCPQAVAGRHAEMSDSEMVGGFQYGAPVPSSGQFVAARAAESEGMALRRGERLS